MCNITACNLKTYNFLLNKHKKYQQKSNIQRKLHFKSKRDDSKILEEYKCYMITLKIEDISV